jgi:hypothetical protein
MTKRRKNGGRHASVGDDRYINAAVEGVLAAYPGARVIFSRVIPKASKSGKPGTWRPKHPLGSADGGRAILLFSDSCTVEGRVYLSTRHAPFPRGVEQESPLSPRSGGAPDARSNLGID